MEPFHLGPSFLFLLLVGALARAAKRPPWCHCKPEVEPSRNNNNVWVHAGREAPSRAADKAPEAVAEGPGAQPEGARGSGQTSGPRRQVLGWLPGAQEPVEALRESRYTTSQQCSCQISVLICVNICYFCCL